MNCRRKRLLNHKSYLIFGKILKKNSWAEDAVVVLANDQQDVSGDDIWVALAPSDSGKNVCAINGLIEEDGKFVGGKWICQHIVKRADIQRTHW